MSSFSALYEFFPWTETYLCESHVCSFMASRVLISIQCWFVSRAMRSHSTRNTSDWRHGPKQCTVPVAWRSCSGGMRTVPVCHPPLAACQNLNPPSLLPWTPLVQDSTECPHSASPWREQHPWTGRSVAGLCQVFLTTSCVKLKCLSVGRGTTGTRPETTALMTWTLGNWRKKMRSWCSTLMNWMPRWRRERNRSVPAVSPNSSSSFRVEGQGHCQGASRLGRGSAVGSWCLSRTSTPKTRTSPLPRQPAATPAVRWAWAAQEDHPHPAAPPSAPASSATRSSPLSPAHWDLDPSPWTLTPLTSWAMMLMLRMTAAAAPAARPPWSASSLPACLMTSPACPAHASPRWARGPITTSPAARCREHRPGSMTSPGNHCPRTGPLRSSWGRSPGERKKSGIHPLVRKNSL